MQFFVIDELYGKVQDKGWRGRSRWDIHQNIKILFWIKEWKAVSLQWSSCIGWNHRHTTIN